MDLLAAEFPAFLPEDGSLQAYSGFIQVQDVDFRLRIALPHGDGGSLSAAAIECEWPLQQLLLRVQPAVKQRLASSTTLYEFLVELRDILERLLQTEPAQEELNSGYYQRFMADVEAIGWSAVTNIDPTLTTLQLDVKDARGRPHALSLRLSAQYPQVAPTCTCALPAAFSPRWTPSSTLADLLAQYKEALAKYQDVWDMLDEIDAQTWVLEPENPTRNITMRRIAVGKNCTLQIDIDPQNPRALPECRFMGSDAAIGPLRQRLSENVLKWNPELSVLSNIKTLLATELPSPSTSKKEDFSSQCSICYAYRLGDAVPDKSCDGCRQQFHEECLVEWLRSVPTTRQTFNVLVADCPYCGAKMTVKITR